MPEFSLTLYTVYFKDEFVWGGLSPLIKET